MSAPHEFDTDLKTTHVNHVPRDVMYVIFSFVKGVDRISIMCLCSSIKRWGYEHYFPSKGEIHIACFYKKMDMLYSLLMNNRIKCMSADIYDTLLKWSTAMAHIPLVTELLKDKYSFPIDATYLWSPFDDRDKTCILLDIYQKSERVDLAAYNLHLINLIDINDTRVMNILKRDKNVINYLDFIEANSIKKKLDF